jgi:hypothetical protein
MLNNIWKDPHSQEKDTKLHWTIVSDQSGWQNLQVLTISSIDQDYNNMNFFCVASACLNWFVMLEINLKLKIYTTHI